MIKRLYDAYNNSEYKEYLKIFDEYISNGYGLSIELIIQYIKVLNKLRYIDKGVKLLNNFDKELISNNMESELALLWFNLNEFDRALEVINNKKELTIYDEYLKGKTLLRMGNHLEAYKVFNELLIKETLLEHLIESINKFIQEVDNKEKGAFVEIGYKDFVKNGNELEPGHIIYVKKIMENSMMINEDPKKNKRPYMVWKVEDDLVYMFPVTTKVRALTSNKYRFMKEKYLNSVGDRTLKDRLCVTTLDQVLFVNDKVNEIDYKISINKLFKHIYFDSTKKEKESMSKFLYEYAGMPRINDIVCYMSNGESLEAYFVLDSKQDRYKTVKVDIDTKQILSSDVVYQKRKRFVYKVIRLSDETRKALLCQINDKANYPNVMWSKIKFNNQSLIIVSEQENHYECIHQNCMGGFYMFEEIPKDSGFTIDGFLNSDEITKLSYELHEYKERNHRRFLSKRKISY